MSNLTLLDRLKSFITNRKFGSSDSFELNMENKK